jgi:hypothetical protein
MFSADIHFLLRELHHTKKKNLLLLLLLFFLLLFFLLPFVRLGAAS